MSFYISSGTQGKKQIKEKTQWLKTACAIDILVISRHIKIPSVMLFSWRLKTLTAHRLIIVAQPYDLSASIIRLIDSLRNRWIWTSEEPLQLQKLWNIEHESYRLLTYFKRTVHPKRIIPSSFTHPRDISKGLPSPVEHKSRYFEEQTPIDFHCMYQKKFSEYHLLCSTDERK